MSVAPGDTPLAPCGPNQIQVHLGGGDITSITAGTGLQGGTTNGDATLSVQPSYRLPQTCSFGAVAKWTGSAWECGAAADTDVSAIGGFSYINGASDGMPDVLATVGKLLLPAGKYAIFAKIQVYGGADENQYNVEHATCKLIAESDEDVGYVSTHDGNDHVNGMISLNLLHEFTGEGFAEVTCQDFGNLEDYADSRWGELRITAIKLGSFENVPLTR